MRSMGSGEMGSTRRRCYTGQFRLASAFLFSVTNGPVLLQLFVLKVAQGNFENSGSCKYVLRKVLMGPGSYHQEDY